ncbi:MAG: thioredoxin family protein [Actinomycetota bacterium]|nr:thioredoxin family protein [Actinomycetota bacterium]MDZ4233574.1 thioredoxin family protein [Dietzia sp.]
MQPARNRKTLVLIVVAAAFALLIFVKIGTSAPTPVSGSPSAGDTGGAAGEPATAVAAYEAAIAEGSPIFLNFGLSYCANCAEMEESVQEVLPDYADEVIYLHVMTDEPAGQELAKRFSFQFVPTSYFIRADGEILDSYTGKLDAAGVRQYLDALLADR